MSEWLLIAFAGLCLPFLLALPLRWVAAMGRAGGWVAWHLDRRHRQVALSNLEKCLGATMDSESRFALAREHFRRLGENYASALRTSVMTWNQVALHVDVSGLTSARSVMDAHPNRSIVVAIGHFGNFELFTWAKQAFPGIQIATTYRSLRQSLATQMLLRLRRRSGCLFFERRTESAALRRALRTQRLAVGFLADQHDGRGIRLPFLGQDAGTSIAPAVFALRYGCPLITAFCFRVSFARWRLEMGDEIPTRNPDGGKRPIADITLDVNRSFERAIRRDPANWFWVHRRWKPGPSPSSCESQKVAIA